MEIPGKINNNPKKRILIAPLDWGLGHATRCIPLIKLLIDHGAEPVIAAEDPVARLLKNEFPDLEILKLSGYRVSYSSNKNFFFLKMLMQTQKIQAAVKHENQWLKRVIEELKIDAVISDNRFGLYTNKIPCVFITHQLSIKTGNKFLDKQAQKINYKYINRFTECWVPDINGKDSLAGELSHPTLLPGIPVKYLGILTRFKKKEKAKKYDLLVMISGPEPQRSIFENLLLKELNSITGKVVLLRGLPAEQVKPEVENKNVIVFNHLPAPELNEIILESKLVIARSGYSTIMDLVALNQKAILVPTPGQTEQEWLAKYLQEKRIFYTVEQENFSLKRELENVKNFEFAALNIETSIDKNLIAAWLEKVPCQ